MSRVNIEELIGRRFFSLTVTSVFKSKKTMVSTVCDCGNKRESQLSDLTHGKIKSCGCIRRKATIERSTTHGMRHHPLSGIRQNIISRCYNQNVECYPYYGGRGITVCDEWRESPYSFIKWAIDNGWSRGLQIDRIDNNLGYAPNNCRVCTREINCRNKRSNKLISYNGEVKPLVRWCEDLGLPYKRTLMRLFRGKSVIESFNLFPLKPSPKNI